MGILAGLSKKETLLSTPGEVWDLTELYVRQNGLRKTEEEEGG